jgi:hypothetical protein
MKKVLILAALTFAVCALAPAAEAQMKLQYRLETGGERVYERVVRSETVVTAGNQTRKTVTEVPLTRRELTIEKKDDPPSTRIVTLDTPVGERLLLFEESGIDRLSTVPEASRLRPMPPMLASQWRDLRGMPLEKPEAPDDPTRALEFVQADMRYLPEGPVKPGDTWTREVAYGEAKAVITTTYAEQKAVGDVPCAVLQSSAKVTFAGDKAARINVGAMTSEMAWAIDGSGWQTHRGTLEVTEKAAESDVTQHVVRTFQETLTGRGKADEARLAKARANLEKLEQAMAKVRTEDLDGALAMLLEYLRDNPDDAWVPAVQNLHSGLTQQRMLTQPVPAPRLRLMLRDLQTARDQAGAQGGPQRLAQIDQAIRQVAKVNAKAILVDAADPDPVSRDLAAFGMAFLEDPMAVDRLKQLAGDASAQVRGTAAIGLAIHAKGLPAAALKKLFEDDDVRVRGAAALLVSRTVKPDDPAAAEVRTLLARNLVSPSAWTRMNTVTSLATLAPDGDVAIAKALVDAHNAEKEDRLKPAYLAALRKVTGLEGKTIAAYEAWVAKQPAPDAPPAPKG